MKKAARLSGSLLARKGFASPAAAVPMFGKANRYGHNHHHHIRDVVYDHVDPEEAFGPNETGASGDAFVNIDLDPPRDDTSAVDGPIVDVDDLDTDEVTPDEDKPNAPRSLMERVQDSLKSLHFHEGEREAVSEPGSEAGEADPSRAVDAPEEQADATEVEARAPDAPKPRAKRKAAAKRANGAPENSGSTSGALPAGCCRGEPSGKRVAMTLRLDHPRHLRLRVLSAHVNRSSQDILTEALDTYLDSFAHMPEMKQCDCLRGEPSDT